MTKKTFHEVVQLYQALNKEFFQNKGTNKRRCDELIDNIKMELLTFNFLPIDTAASKTELLLARDFLEICCMYSIDKGDIEAFDRYYSQLKVYYIDYPKDLLESAYMYQLTGCHLLSLLAQNKLATFHTELELLPLNELQENIYIKFPTDIEQYLMEGSYNKLFLAQNNVPAENYTFFIDLLIGTVRNEIAECMEKSYGKMLATEAVRILFFKTAAELSEYASRRNWSLSPDGFIIFPKNNSPSEELEPIQFTKNLLQYAKELEVIL